MNPAPVMNFFNGDPVESGKDYKLFRQALAEGGGEAAVFSLFSGIELYRLDIRAPYYLPLPSESLQALELSHCMEGRAECQMNDGCFQFIGEGDLFLNPVQNRSRRIDLPLGRCRAILILIDPDKAAPEVQRRLPDVPLDLHALKNRFFNYEKSCDKCFLISAREELHHIFAGMYAIPTALATDYLRLKVLELLIFLYLFDPASEKQTGLYTRQQVDAVKQVHKLLISDAGQRYTIEELAQKFCISATALKTHFKGVFGQSIASYMKEFRIRQAAELLLSTDRSIAETAQSVGYESQSKFTAEFKKIMHVTPAEYRKHQTAPERRSSEGKIANEFFDENG